jgi:urease subunit gamma/beta
MRLLPRERDRLLLFLAAELASRRRERGLLLNAAEATAIAADAVCEAARDGVGYGAAVQAGYDAVGPGDVLEGVAALVDRVEVEALFADGMRLVVLDHPVARDTPPDPLGDEEVGVAWLAGAIESVEVVNEGGVPVALTSHFHAFEVNRALVFDRRRAWGMRAAIPAGEKVVWAPGETRELRLLPIGGLRVIRGHGGLADGALDDPAVREAAFARARERGYRDVG